MALAEYLLLADFLAVVAWLLFRPAPLTSRKAAVASRTDADILAEAFDGYTKAQLDRVAG